LSGDGADRLVGGFHAGAVGEDHDAFGHEPAPWM
jgi:hypothetical protein